MESALYSEVSGIYSSDTRDEVIERLLHEGWLERAGAIKFKIGRAASMYQETSTLKGRVRRIIRDYEATPNFYWTEFKTRLIKLIDEVEGENDNRL